MGHPGNLFLVNLAMVLGVAAITTVVFQKLRAPVVLGYILAGLIVGPHVPVPLFADEEMIHALSELGVILLLFSIGLEFTIGKLLRVGGTAGIIALVQVSAMLLLGDLAGRAFGWTARESLYTGAFVAISSTTIIAKAFEERGIGGRLRELVLAVLIVEDLLAILLLAGFTTLSSGQLSAGALAATAGRLGLFLIGVVAIGFLIVPRLVRRVVKTGRKDTLTVLCIGICFGTALLAEHFGYSVALGAFLAGSLVAESGEGPRIEHLLMPVRDLFAAVFFVSVGLLIDPALALQHWVAILVLSALVIAGKTIGVSLPSFFTGAGLRDSIRAGMSLAQIGEFSFIIVGLGLSLGAVRDFLYPVAVSVSVITTLTTPWLIGASEKTAEAVERRLPKPLQNFVALYGSWLARLQQPSQAKANETGVRRIVGLLALDASLLIAIVIAVSRFFERMVAMLAGTLGKQGAELALLAGAAVLCAPFVIGIVRLVGALGLKLSTAALPRDPTSAIDTGAHARHALVVSLQLVAALAIGLPLLALTLPFIPFGGLALLPFALLLVPLVLRLWRSAASLQGDVRAGAQVIVEALAKQARGPAAPNESAQTPSASTHAPSA